MRRRYGTEQEKERGKRGKEGIGNYIIDNFERLFPFRDIRLR